jgi:hypothetical protein
MNARPEVMPILVEKRMRRWLNILWGGSLDRRCKPATARRNLLRLVTRHEGIARKLGITVVGIYSL